MSNFPSGMFDPGDPYGDGDPEEIDRKERAIPRLMAAIQNAMDVGMSANWIEDILQGELEMYTPSPVSDEELAAAKEMEASEAFNRYVVAKSGRTYDDKPIPAWQDLPLDVQNAWIAVIEPYI